MDLSLLSQYMMNGLMLAMIYTLVALGFTLFFGVLNIIHFAHGDMFMIGAFAALVAFIAATSLGLQSDLLLVIFVIIASVAALSLLGVVIARYLVLPMKGGSTLNVLLLTMMVGTILRESVRLFYPEGANPKPFPALLPKASVELGDVAIRADNLIMVAISIITIVTVSAVISRTKLGLAIRAVALDEETAETMGINYTLIVMVTFAIGSALAAVAGVISGLYYNEINFSMGLMIGAIGFSAAIIGGLGNFYGAVLGSFIFAFLQVFFVIAMPFPSAYKDVFAFAVVIIIMTWRPTGLIGERTSERV
jgi:branched-chain amino acid transport system permease protein